MTAENQQAQHATDNLPAVVPPRREIIEVHDTIPMFDTGMFEQMIRVAGRLARGSLLPPHLRVFRNNDGKIVKDDAAGAQFDEQGTAANCLLVVNRAKNWNADPVAVAQCMAIVHGRECYEGKMVAAVLDAKMGVTLHHHFTGEQGTDAYRIFLSDVPFTPEIIAQLKPGANLPGMKLWDGSVGEWKTTGANSPWKPKDYRRMLIYRGTRDWARIYKPALMAGVYTMDELEDMAEDTRARRANPVREGSGLAARLDAPGPEGFSPDHAQRELEDHNAGGSDVKTGTPADANSAGPGRSSQDDESSKDASTGESGNADDQKNKDISTETVSGTGSPDEAGNNPANNSVADDATPPTSNAATSSPAGSETGGDAPSQDEQPVDGAAKIPTPDKGLTDYSNALQRVTQQKSLRKISDDFRNKNAWTTDQAIWPTLKTIYEVHQKRITEGLAPGEIESQLRKAGVK